MKHQSILEKEINRLKKQFPETFKLINTTIYKEATRPKLRLIKGGKNAT